MEKFDCSKKKISELFNLGIPVGRVKQILYEQCNINKNIVSGYSHQLIYGLFGQLKHHSSRFGLTRLYKKSFGRFTGFGEIDATAANTIDQNEQEEED